MTQRELYNKYVTALNFNPNVSDVRDAIFANPDLAETVRKLLLSKIQHRGRFLHTLTDFQDRQTDIFLSKYLHGFNTTDIFKDLEYMKGEVQEVEEAIQEGDDAHILYELADVVIYCYGMAEMLGQPLDDYIFNKMWQNTQRKYDTDLE